MPVVTKEQALELLTNEVQKKLGADELLEVYNEVFPDGEAHEDVAPLVEQLVDHINSGLEIDVLMDLWGLIIPKHHNVWYDEVDERIHYNEETEAISAEQEPAVLTRPTILALPVRPFVAG